VSLGVIFVDLSRLRLEPFGLYSIVNLFAIDGYVLRGRNAQTDLIALYAENGNANVVADYDGFVGVAG
jgi:hypothetical protein